MPHPHPRGRLRQVDVKAEHFERQLQRVEQERDQWEKKYEVRATADWRGIRYHHTDCVSRAQEMEAKYRKSKAELDELVANMEGL